MRKQFGFTLIELMIVIAIIAIIAAIAIPGLLRARISANEGSASASLRSLASGEASFQKANSVDQDEDGTGEYGVLNELTGQASRRGVSAQGNTQTTYLPISIGDMSVAMKATLTCDGAGLASKSGYYYQIYLPAYATVPLTDSPGLTALSPIDWTTTDGVAIQQQENRWICYAWPASYKSSGLRAFVCDQSAEVYASANTDPATNQGYWDGTDTYPNFSSAMTTKGVSNVDEINGLNWDSIGVRDQKNCIDTNHLWVPSQ